MIDTDQRNDKPGSVLEVALSCLRAGLSLIPIKLDGSKAPAGKLLPTVRDEKGGKDRVTWDPFKEQLPTEDEVHVWFGGRRPPGIAIIGGKVSGNLLILDFEFLDFFEEWLALVEAQAPGLAARLPLVRTPGRDEAGGRHAYARSSGPTIPTGKLARVGRAEAERRAGDPGRTTAVEVKAEGGYVLTVGCPAECHPTGRLYRHVAGPPIRETPTLTESEVKLLLACARALERGDKASADRTPAAHEGAGNRPGDDFNRRADWRHHVLGPAWQTVRESGDVLFLCRPGKDEGVSATIGHCRSELAGPKLYVFSTNAEPFEAEKAYSKFEAYTLLEHAGDFRAAAKELAAKGYGEQKTAGSGRGQASRRDGFRVGNLVLRPGPAHRTPSRLTVPLAVLRDGCQVDAVNLTKSMKGRREVAQLLARHFWSERPAGEEIDRVLAAVIADAEQALDRGERPTGPTVEEIVRARVPQAQRLAFVTQRGAWSEARGVEVTRAEFLTFSPRWLVEATKEAVDAPQGLPHLLDALRCALSVLWSDLRETLPTAEAAALTPETAAAAATLFRAALVKIWNAPCTNERTVGKNGELIVMGGSLATKAQEYHRRREEILRGDARPRWQQLHSPYLAWWRPAKSEGGAVSRLAMHYGLAAQVRADLPCVHDQHGLTVVGEALGMVDRTPEVPTRMGHGRERLAVLVLDLSDNLLDNPVSWKTEEEDPETDREDRQAG